MSRDSKTPTAPFVTDTNAWTKLGLKVALKEAVTQGADKISWTTGEQQNERYDLSKQVDEIGWQKNENGTYNITPKKDGSVIGTREMMANLTIKQIEDYVGKEVAEKIQNEEGKVWDGGSVKQGKLTGQQLKVGGKGMKGFYGEPSEGKEGIVGGVAKALVKELTGKPGEIVETKIVDKDTPSIYKRYQDKKTELAEKENRVNELYDIINNSKTDMPKEAREYNLLVDEVQDLRKEIKDIERTSPNALKQATSTSTQHSIEITPELRAAVEKGQPLFMVGYNQYLCQVT